MTEQEESETRRFIREALSQGRTVRDIAAELDISTQRVYQQMAAIRAQAQREGGTP